MKRKSRYLLSGEQLKYRTWTQKCRLNGLNSTHWPLLKKPGGVKALGAIDVLLQDTCNSHCSGSAIFSILKTL